ncbi:unnamed protein product [Nippostrongylus brasiliensis]|uniref:C2H2-type domain-containing protein n=1 Tax=Nippostrongylus brasiliensis TaxID=27835 RepID=A0A158R047_NIPBR|nr:unnamed protein product [Nippostrongylus brasiliensis]
MPYRAELKRPDLKGNETLRSHMFRIHSISRMFMCRCCNWAFSDKTSLHIHMQSMLRNGTPGEVAILARSSTEDGTGAVVEDSPGSSPSYSAKNLLQHQFVGHDAIDATTTTSSNLNNNNNNNNGNNNNNNTKAANNNSNCVKSIFPMIMRKDNLLTTQMKKDYNRSLEDSDYDVLKITMSESDMHEEEIESRQNTTEEPSCKQPYCNEDLEKSEQSCSNSATENVQIQTTKPECSDCQRDVLERRPTSIDENRSGASGDHSQLAIPPVPAAVFNPNLPPALLFMHNPAVKFFLHSLVQSQLSRPSC